MNMRLLVIRIFFIVTSLGFLQAVCAQAAGIISGKFINVRFPQFVDEIEKQTNCHFFYDPAEMDTVAVNVDADQLSLQDLLQKVLANTFYQFTIDSSLNVFVYNKKYQLKTKLPADFFAAKPKKQVEENKEPLEVKS